MTDLGHPFSQSFQTLIEALEERVRSGVEQPAQTDLLFDSATTSYLLPREVETVTRVSGLVSGRFIVFTRNVDYVQNGNRLIWQPPGGPDVPVRTPGDGERFTVEYTYRDRPSGLSDFNAGSVVGTLVRAVARELTLMYDQVDEAYRRAFIDYAEGVALDNVVALLGVTRNAPQYSRGEVTFFTKKAPRDTILIVDGTRVTDESGRVFVTLAAASIARVADKSSAPVEADVAVGAAGMARLRNWIAEVVAIWDQADAEPTSANRYERADVSPDQPYGADERTIKVLARGTSLPARVRVRYIPRSVTVPIAAQQPGVGGDVGPRTIVVMPTPPAGVDGVINEQATDGGKDAESDAQLRDRARFALERSGNATLNALKYAVLDVDSVTAVEVLDHLIDERIPLGEVRVRYAGEALDKNEEETKVRAAVERTRAAGVLVQLETITTLIVSGTVYIVPEPGTPSSVANSLRAEMIAALKALAPGQSLSLRRLGALAYSVPGVADVAEFQLQALRNPPSTGDGAAAQPIASDPYPVARGELIKVDEANLALKLLAALRVTGWRAAGAGSYAVDLQILDDAGVAVVFTSFTIALEVALRGRPKDQAEDVRESLGSVRKQVIFSKSATATLTVGAADLTQYKSNVYKPEVDLSVTPATYPGLRSDGAKTTIVIAA